MKTRITDLLGIRYPIIQGGMMWVGRAELAAAVSNAGGLGTVTALTQPSPSHLEEEIARCRTMTREPFTDNLTILPAASSAAYLEYAQLLSTAGARIVETAGNHPPEVTDLFLSKGLIVVRKCTSVRHALSAQKRDTSLFFRTFGNTARVFRNRIADQVVSKEQRPGGALFDEIRPLVAGARGRESSAKLATRTAGCSGPGCASV